MPLHLLQSSRKIMHYNVHYFTKSVTWVLVNTYEALFGFVKKTFLYMKMKKKEKNNEKKTTFSIRIAFMWRKGNNTCSFFGKIIRHFGTYSIY